MYLSKLEIFGFKSFANKTVVDFNSGVTSIVGPNGCGKTNIVDAIRWVLGEQRSGALRSDKMENVIFNGTSNKKPMGMSEVSLTIENTKGILPSEYSEITITRRIFRSGESEYLLNKNICRLKDITNLFMDTGIGANAYSVIELKMVETILSSKADERRILFEEAAGVNKYKLRRRLALRKLDEVKADLTRVNDIVSEVEKKVNSLERQAKRADKHNKLSTTLRELELDLAEREFALFHFQKDEFKNLKEENFKKKILAESELARLDSELQLIKNSLNETELLLKVKRSSIENQTESIFLIQKDISVDEEKKNLLEKNILRYQQEIDELSLKQKEMELFLSNSDKLIDEHSSQIILMEAQKKASEEKVNQIKIELDEKRNYLKSRSEIILNNFREISSKENELSNLEKNLKEKNDQINNLNSKILSLTNNVAKSVGFLEDLEVEKQHAEKKFSEAEAFYLHKQTEKEQLEKNLSELKNRELDGRSTLNGIKERIKFIQSLISKLEGVSKGARALLDYSGWAAGDKALLANVGSSDEHYRFAVEAALKNNLNNILIESIDDLQNGIAYLKENGIGKVSFILNRSENPSKSLLDNLFSFLKNRRKKKLEKETGFLGWAYTFIKTDDKWKKIFQKNLSDTAVVDSLENAFKFSEKYPLFKFTTLTGDFIDQNGVVEAGSTPLEDDSMFGRQQLLESLLNELPERELAINNLKNEITTIENQISAIDLRVLSEKGRLLMNEISNIEKQITQFEFEKKKADDEIESARKTIQLLADESNRIDTKKENLNHELQKILQQKKEADIELENLENDFASVDVLYNTALSLYNQNGIQLERLLGEKRNTENSIKRANENLETIINSITKRENDINSAIEEKKQVVKNLDQNSATLIELEKVKDILLEEEKNIDANYNEIKRQITEIENQLRTLRQQRENLSNEIHSADLHVQELDIKISNLIASIQENYSLTINKKAFDDLENFDFKSRTEEVHNLKQQMKNLGPINLLAYSEYEEEKQRFDFLSKQRLDLIESEKDVLETINEINTSAQQLFSETFEKIRANFTNIFRGLFNPGDEADLRLEENADPLEAKIEIVAKPKGKRPTSIELLSGGEKTLTAIALLFAIYLVKPSPFCILDEIDAPLDDGNLDRFTKIIKDFSNDTQFIVVTHNKRTMEAAQTLYGVTMQEEGISKLVSVRFNDDFNIAS